jgi:DNA-binding XRE family transcriptional regulator
MSIDPKVFKQVRKALGLSQQELADAIGLSRVTINKMERGKLKQGIPDEIANRLLALKPRGPAGRTLQLNVKALPAPMQDDKHLWDNEEDES